MNPSESYLFRTARWLTFTSAVSVLFSIAACQILLALAVAALLLSGEKLRIPPIALPLGLFLLGTVVSLALSGNPSAGLPQIRKFYVFLELVVVVSTLRDLAWIRRLFLSWAGVGALIALRGYVQFAAKFQEARELGKNFYEYYVGERITGFMSHWMTFSGQEMFALLMLLAFILFAPGFRRHLWLWILCGLLMAVAILLGFTRSIWMATAAAFLYLTWFWRRWLVALVPVLGLLAFFASPPSVRERFSSIMQPKKDTDSNEHRIVTWRTGLNMIRRHPWFGLGPEGVKLHFDDYVPPDIPRPLPRGWYGHLHNIYLHYAAERGVPTMLVLMWLLLRIVYDFWRGLRALAPERTDVRFLLHGGIAIVIATMVGGFFELNLGDSEVLTMFLVVVGSGYVALEQVESRLRKGAVVV
jgi:putative inorganic carbon (hco3(-)) transporter